MARVIGLDEAIADFLRVDRDTRYDYCPAYAVDKYGSCGSGSGSGCGPGTSFGHGFSSYPGSGYNSACGSGSGLSSCYDGCYGNGSSYNGCGYDPYCAGIKNICGAQVNIIDGMPTIIRSIHGNAAAGGVLAEDLSLRRCYVVKGGGFFAHGETLREAQESLERKILDNMPTAERIAEFIGRFEPGKKYPARLYYDWHHILTGSCKMGREAFARDHGYDLDKDELTPEEFMELTKDAYGGSVIRELIAAWTKAAMGPAGPGKGD